MYLGERIYTLRTAKNLSQEDLANALNVSRQSISKWETNSSVPELEKLIKLSEIFGVSLDELVLDKKPEPTSEPETKVVYVEPVQSGSSRKTIGTVLLCFAAFVWLLVALSGDIIAGFILASPFIVCGLICLLVRRFTGLWCFWAVYLFVELYLRFATGINWQFILLPQVYTGGHTIHLIVAWVLWLTFAALTLITALRLRKAWPITLRRDGIGAACAWAVYFLSRIVFVAPALQNPYEAGYSQAYRYVSSVSGWIRNIFLVVSLVFTVRWIAALWDRRKRK